MNNLDKVIYQNKAIIPYITCGDPDIKTCEKLIYAMKEGGVDRIIMGMPFSDPIAQSEYITSSSVRAHGSGVNVDKVFDLISAVRAHCDIDIVLATYANVIYSCGAEQFAKRMKDSGAYALIVNDAPYEEKDEFAHCCNKFGINYISQVVAGIGDRAICIAKEAEGFLYCLPISQPLSKEEILALEQIKKVSDLPCALALHSPTSYEVKEAAKIYDGVIIEGAIVQLIQQYGRSCISYVKEYIKTLKEAIAG